MWRWTLVLVAAVLSTTMPSTTWAAPSPQRQVVHVPIARLLSKPGKGKTQAKLRYGTPVEVQRKHGAYVRVRAVPPQGEVVGWVKRSQLASSSASSTALIERAGAAQRGQETLLQKACAADPSSLPAIEAYAAFLDDKRAKSPSASKAETTLYYVRKGWLAARRRQLHWDGPLYPIVDGVAVMQAPCDGRATANGRRKTIPNDELRARAFPFFSSGKSVAVSEHGYGTQKLKAPLCHQGQLGYRMKKAKKGALVSSWRVAGFRVFALEPHNDGFVGGRVRVVVGEGGVDVFETTLDGEVALGKAAFPALPVDGDVRPLAWFSESEAGEVLLLMQREGTRSCNSGVDVQQWLVRMTRTKGGPATVDLGRMYSGSLDDGCRGARFVPLPHEPRSIERDVLLSSSWKQEPQGSANGAVAGSSDGAKSQ